MGLLHLPWDNQAVPLFILRVARGMVGLGTRGCGIRGDCVVRVTVVGICRPDSGVYIDY